MSDKTLRGRPVVERIARLFGGSSFCDPRGGTGGIPELSDQDIAAALGMVRTVLKEDDDCKAKDYEIGAEVLETYYAGTQRHRSVIRAAYLRHNPLKKANESALIARRMGATLAVQMLAGMKYSRFQEVEYAYICRIRLETLRAEVRDAHSWYLDRLNESFKGFMKACSRAYEERKRSELIERKERVERVLADIKAEQRRAS